MDANLNTLNALLTQNKQLERNITPDISQFEQLINELHIINNSYKELKESIQDDSTQDNQQVLSLLTQASKSNKKRAQILTNILKKKQGTAAYSYATYRRDMSELKKLLGEREDMHQAIKAATDTSQETFQSEVSIQLGLEDTMLIRLLIAMSAADSDLHALESEAINDHYKNIVQDDIDNTILQTVFDEIKEQGYDELVELAAHAERIHPEVKKLMVLAALEVAIADSHFHPKEQILLQRIAASIGIPHEEYETILSILSD